MSYSNDLYMEQVINESGIKGNTCSKKDCTLCKYLIACYNDASKEESIIKDVNYGGYETETHY